MSSEIFISVIASVLSSGVVVAVINYLTLKGKVSVETDKILAEAEAIKFKTYVSISEYWQGHAKDLMDEINSIKKLLSDQVERGDLCEKTLSQLQQEINAKK